MGSAGSCNVASFTVSIDLFKGGSVSSYCRPRTGVYCDQT